MKKKQELPEGLPPVPDGFVYWGKGPLREFAFLGREKDVCGVHLSLSTNWLFPSNGRSGEWHYAIRAGSEIARLNGIGDEPEQPKPLMASDMTMRDAFAAAALTGLLAAPDRSGSFELYSDDAYAYADAMISEREKGGQE